MNAHVSISLLLSAVMLASVGAALAMRRRAPAIALLMVLAALAGLYFVWVPSHLTAVANALGVGRGTDLLLYLWVSVTFLALAGLALQLRHLHRQLTLLARSNALERARRDAPQARAAGDEA